MQSISRRGFVISAATAGAAFGLDGPLEFLRPAFAQKPDPKLMDKGFVKFKVGDIEVIQMYDGVWEKAHDPNFVKNASLDEVKAALKAGGLTDELVPIPFTVTAVRIQGQARAVRRGNRRPGCRRKRAWSRKEYEGRRHRSRQGRRPSS